MALVLPRAANLERVSRRRGLREDQQRKARKEDAPLLRLQLGGDSSVVAKDLLVESVLCFKELSEVGVIERVGWKGHGGQRLLQRLSNEEEEDDTSREHAQAGLRHD